MELQRYRPLSCDGRGCSFRTGGRSKVTAGKSAWEVKGCQWLFALPFSIVGSSCLLDTREKMEGLLVLWLENKCSRERRCRVQVRSGTHRHGK